MRLLLHIAAIGLLSACSHDSGDSCGSPHTAHNLNTEAKGCDASSSVEVGAAKQASFAKVRSRCQTEIKQLCQEVECKTLMKPTQVCLMANDENLSKDCISEINRHIGEFQPYVKPLNVQNKGQ